MAWTAALACQPREGSVELLRARRERPHALIINDPQPVASTDDIWATTSQFAIIGIFILLLGAAFDFARPVLLPIMAALIVAMTFGPIIKHAKRRGVHPWLTATLIVLALVAAAGIAVTLLAAPVAAWIDRAPEIAARIKEKLYVLDLPLAALRDLQNTLMPPAANTVKVEPSQISLLAPVVTAVTPAVAQIVIFAATLFFALVAQVEVRKLSSLFASRDAKLRYPADRERHRGQSRLLCRDRDRHQRHAGRGGGGGRVGCSGSTTR